MKTRNSILGGIAIAATLLVPSCARRANQELELANAAMKRRDYETALVHFDNAIELEPKRGKLHYGRASAYHGLERYEEAVACYTTAIRLSPSQSVAYADRGLTYWQLKDYKKAIRDFERAIQLNPDEDHARYGLAWLLATSPDDELRDGQRAVQLATESCERTGWKQPRHLWTLAAAYAEVGDFEQAIRWQKQAMNSPEFPADKLDRARQRLALYEQGMPYREKVEE